MRRLLEANALGPVHLLPTATRLPRAVVHDSMKSHWTGPPLYNPASSSPHEVTMNILRHEADGEPFFTKEALQELQAQLLRPLEEGEKYVAIGIDGTPVEFEPATGQVNEHVGHRFVNGPVALVYHSWGVFVGHAAEKKYLDAASYCRIVPMHVQQWIHPETDEIFMLPPRPVEVPSRLLRSAVFAWEPSATWAAIREVLVAAREKHTITTFVGFACGPMFGESPSATQHALVWMIIRLFRRDGKGESDEPLACSLQDPIYDAQEKRLLNLLKMTVVEDPQAFLDVEDSSIVFTCNSDVPVKEIVLDIARPAIMIIDDITRINSIYDPVTNRVLKAIGDSYEMFDFPDHEAFGKMAIYVRK
ncbi:uncharacterized protein BO72DRAFT_523854 [Aspergillus fijiensis CBS 313.89]|uniref:SRR1-like domain-containing protein n=1 Tax=Aspergillus fijiensis CBS 313.89 TaxID=1448319 RepID=A0A8G1W3V0_9EURO|nr:uncharacterized protein BO72DRAFT_523854 [Aspergillus fijiensis CBS 313.89]RAK81961.1 hypothetical protein BO72DRAFT_523854 [Aspergillus fijiensis CBS 313.89]